MEWRSKTEMVLTTTYQHERFEFRKNAKGNSIQIIKNGEVVGSFIYTFDLGEKDLQRFDLFQEACERFLLDHIDDLMLA